MADLDLHVLDHMGCVSTVVGQLVAIITTSARARAYHSSMAELELHGTKGSEPTSGVLGAPRNDSKLRTENAAGCNRVHVVMVPGFGGFDALGQLRYYPRTTAAAEAWREADPKRARHAQDGIARDRLVLHYFDNLPTAGVNTRAHRLLRYLLDRQARNDFRDGDVIALVGHSTGGLDIRRLLQMLLQIPEAVAAMSPAERKRLDDPVAHALRSKIKRVVFMSVPQRGTNIANWVRDLEPWPLWLVASLRCAVDALDFWPVERLETAFTRQVLQPLRARLDDSPLRRWIPGLYSAVFDVVAEDALRASADPVEAADGREALAQLSLFLNQTDGDFLAIEDLAAPPLAARTAGSRRRRIAARNTTEVARASRKAREAEIRAWTEHGIQTMSFATFATPGAGSQRDRTQSRRWRAFLGLIPWPFGKTDGLFRLVYRACEWGPFADHARPARDSGAPDQSGAGALFAGSRDAKHYVPFRDGHPNRDFIRSWENDGIVNTASMLWPNGPATHLVQGDHADIIGHFAPKKVEAPQSGRRYDAYDIFGSHSGFDEARFELIWYGIFDFCLNALTAVDRVSVVA